jgi:hypothetical protein
MFDCETCRSQMLEYLYDLLEGDERQDWEAHLKDCSACQAALVQAKNQQQLLAKAAKMEFADVRFSAPPAEAPAPLISDQPAVLPLQRARRPRSWRRWLAAAVVLVTLCAAIPAVWYGRDYQRAEQTIAFAMNRIEQAQRDHLEARQQLAQLPQQKQERIDAIHKAQADAQLQVELQGPSTIRVGAPTDYQIYTRNLNLNRELTPANVSVEVKDQGQTLAKSLRVAPVARGVYRLTLPPDLPVRPNSHPTLVVSARRENGSQVELKEEMELAAPVYVTHLEIDKPMYQLGETVYFRSLTLDRSSLRPAEQDLNLQFFLALPGPGNPERLIAQGRTALVEEGPNGVHPVLGPDGKPLRGIGSGSFKLDANEAGGEYALIVREANQRFPEQRRKFLVNKYEKPKLNKELDFSRKSYGPGDEVAARCKAKYLDGRPLKNCRVDVAVIIDNKQYGSHGEEKAEAFTFQTDDEGLVNVHFRLPKEIERGLGTVAVKYDDRAMPDTMVRPIPIVLKKLDIEFCPEGGDLVAELPNRVYLQVRNTLGKPADLTGQLLEDGKPIGVTVATLTSEKTPELNQGMGRFEFTPKAGHKYELKVESPIGVAKLHELPPIKPDGVVLSIPAGVVKADEAIPVTVRSTAKRSFMIGAYCRGRLLDSTELTLTPRSHTPRGNAVGNEAREVLRPKSSAGGVCRVTVFEILPGDSARRSLRPVAERLIYRQPAERVEVTLKPDQKSYVPRQTVKLGVEAETEKGEPAPAVVLLRVVDKSVVTLADDKTLRSMPTHFLLTTEVRRPEDLEYADFLLGPHPQAAEALDLLLGTQGWRRFAEQDPTKFRHEQKEDAERLLVTIGQSQPQRTDLTQQELQRVESEYAHRTEELTAQAAQTQKAEQEARGDADYHAALVDLKAYHDFFNRSRLVGAPALAAVLVLAALVFLILALFRQFGRALPYYAATAACAVLVVLLAKFAWQGAPNFPQPQRQIAQATTPTQPEERMFPQAHEVERKQAEGAAVMQNGAAARVRERAMMRKAGDGAEPMFRMAPAAALGRADLKQADKGDFGIQEQLRDAKAAAKREQLGLDNKVFDAQLNLKKAVPQDRLLQNADRGLAAGPAPMVEGKGQAMGEGIGQAMDGRMAPMAPGMARGFARFRPAMGIRGEARSSPTPVMPVRVFAHTRAAGPAEERYDFAETLFWHPVLVLPGGKTEVSFDLCDSLGAFEVTAFAHTLDGRLGAATHILTSRLPFTVQPRTPLEVTVGDKVDIPLAIANNTSEARTARVSIGEHANLSLLDNKEADTVSVPADTTIRKLYRLTPTTQEGAATLAFTGKADGFPADSVRTNFRIVPDGFPIAGSHSDVLEKSATHDLMLPETWIKGTLKCQVQVYPSTLADLQQGLEALLREPNGCFEQTSTSNYPNVLILQYLKESDQAKPEVERRAHELLDRGYQKLISFECLNPAERKKEGYEWFGGTAPAHEALTAYGLMEFRDMARVHEVDPAMLQRTHEYLLHQRDGKGGFKRNLQALDTFGRAPQNITNAYIVWALTESGKDDDISKELNALSEQAVMSKDPYFLSLVANSLINRAKTADAAKLLKKVSELQKSDGHLDAEQTSITGSGGRDLQIETTSLALLGWLKANPGAFNSSVQKAIKWLGQQRGGYGGFGSTQSTILALKALILYTKANKKTPEAGELHLFVGDKQVAALPFAAGSTEPLTLSVPDAETVLRPGKNPVRVEITGKNVFPYTVSWSYRTLIPARAGTCPVKLSAKLDHSQARESETVRLNVHVENASSKGQGMTVAILGLPGGLTVPEDMKQLKDYTRVPNNGERPLVSAFELRGRELVLYWRDLAPDQKIDVPIDLICRVPGEYSGPASRAYLYYNADLKYWVEPLKITIAAKSE